MRENELDEVKDHAGNGIRDDELHVHDGEVPAGDIHEVLLIEAEEEARADDQDAAEQHLGDDVDEPLAALDARGDEEEDEAGDEDAGDINQKDFFL